MRILVEETEESLRHEAPVGRDPKRYYKFAGELLRQILHKLPLGWLHSFVRSSVGKERCDGKEHITDFCNWVCGRIETLLRKPQVLQHYIRRSIFTGDLQDVSLYVLQSILPFLGIHDAWHQGVAPIKQAGPDIARKAHLYAMGP